MLLPGCDDVQWIYLYHRRIFRPLREVLGSNVEANATSEDGSVRELRDEFDLELEETSFVGKTVHAYGHRTIEMLAYPCPGSFLRPTA